MSAAAKKPEPARVYVVEGTLARGSPWSVAAYLRRADAGAMVKRLGRWWVKRAAAAIAKTKAWFPETRRLTAAPTSPPEDPLCALRYVYGTERATYRVVELPFYVGAPVGRRGSLEVLGDLAERETLYELAVALRGALPKGPGRKPKVVPAADLNDDDPDPFDDPWLEDDDR